MDPQNGYKWTQNSKYFSGQGCKSTDIDVFMSNIFNTNKLEQKFPNVAYLVNLMDHNRAKIVKIG